MPGAPVAANYCPEGCYWPCEHRAPGAAAGGAGRWALGPGAGDDPEQAALDEWRLYSIAGVAPAGPLPTLRFCTDCRDSFADPAEHAREHERARQLGEGR